MFNTRGKLLTSTFFPASWQWSTCSREAGQKICNTKTPGCSPAFLDQGHWWEHARPKGAARLRHTVRGCSAVALTLLGPQGLAELGRQPANRLRGNLAQGQGWVGHGTPFSGQEILDPSPWERQAAAP